MLARIGMFIFLAVLLCASPIVQGAVSNGDFDSGLSNWNPVTTVTASSSANNTTGGETGHPHYAKLYANAKPNMVLNPVTHQYEPQGLGTAFAIISQDFAANAGDVLSFDYWNDSTYNVSAVLTVEIPSTFEYIFWDTMPVTTDWTTFQVTLPKTENYRITFQAGGTSDYGETSTWKVDNVRLTSVPEPGVASLLGIGALACGLFVCRRRG
jgi:hypothetical protein